MAHGKIIRSKIPTVVYCSYTVAGGFGLCDPGRELDRGIECMYVLLELLVAADHVIRLTFHEHSTRL